MVDLLLRRKKSKSKEPKAWDNSEDWNNPFGDPETPEARRKERKMRKKKNKSSSKKSRRHQMSEEEYSAMSSKAETLLDDLLEEGESLPMPELEDGEESASIRQSKRNPTSHNPFDDQGEVKPEEPGQEIDRDEYAALILGTKVSHAGVLVQPYEEDKVEQYAAQTQVYNMEDADSIQPVEPSDSEDLEEETQLSRDEPRFSNPISSRKKNTTPFMAPEGQIDDLKRQSTESTEEPGMSEESEEDDYEDSRQLLLAADKRLQYQQYNDEIKVLKKKIQDMKRQEEAMTEQLRRAVETKCDLVLAQTELERTHEQQMLARDDEVRDLNLFIQNLQSDFAKQEMRLLNEFDALDRKCKENQAAHEKEIKFKDAEILELQGKLIYMKNEGVGSSLAGQESMRSRLLAA